MEIWLYDHREKDSIGNFYKKLGISKKLTVTKRGEIRIQETDFLYSLHLKLSPIELEALRQRLNEISGHVIKPLAVEQAKEILDKHRT